MYMPSASAGNRNSLSLEPIQRNPLAKGQRHGTETRLRRMATSSLPLRSPSEALQAHTMSLRLVIGSRSCASKRAAWVRYPAAAHKCFQSWRDFPPSWLRRAGTCSMQTASTPAQCAKTGRRTMGSARGSRNPPWRPAVVHGWQGGDAVMRLGARARAGPQVHGCPKSSWRVAWPCCLRATMAWVSQSRLPSIGRPRRPAAAAHVPIPAKRSRTPSCPARGGRSQCSKGLPRTQARVTPSSAPGCQRRP